MKERREWPLYEGANARGPLGAENAPYQQWTLEDRRTVYTVLCNVIARFGWIPVEFHVNSEEIDQARGC